MFFYDDKLRKSTTKDENTSDGFPELPGRARLMAWLCLFSFVGFVAWCVK